MRSVISSLRNRLTRLPRDERGGVAIMFGLCFPVLAFASLVAVDYSRASSGKQAMQHALDTAALYAARSTATTSDEIDAIGDAAFAAQMANFDAVNPFTTDGDGRIANVTFTVTDTTVVATAVGTVSPIVSQVFLDGDLDIHADTEVVRSINKLEIALVLDTTGSMQGTKLTNLIDAAQNFVTTMEAAANRSTETDPVKISVVPFSTTVRVQSPVDVSAYDDSTHSMSGLPSWLDGRARAIDWDEDIFTNASSSASNRVDRFSKLKAIGAPWGGCVEARAAPYDIRETAPSSFDVDTLFIPFFWPDEPDSSSHYLNDYLYDDSSSTSWSTLQGNPAKYDTTSWKATGTFIPHSAYGAAWSYGPNAACNMQRVMRLSTDFDALRTHISGLVASGETNIPLGLAWGWHTISPNAPFGDGVLYDTPNTTKIIVLMTDGENTMNDTIGSSNSNQSYYHGYGYIWQGRLGTTSSSTSTRTNHMNDRLVNSGESLCGNIKAQDIHIYTVGVGVSSSSRTLLKQCATSNDNYYDVNSTAGNLDAAFDAIAGSIQNLRLSK